MGQINILNAEKDLQARYQRLAAHVVREDLDLFTIQEVVEPDLLQRELLKAGYGYFAFGEILQDESDSTNDVVGVVSRHRILNHAVLAFAQKARAALHAELLLHDKKIHVFSAHLAWGSLSEGQRLRQAEEIDGWAQRIAHEEPHGLIFLGGDLNADEGSRTVRFLQGLDLGTAGTSTYWTDAYKVAGSPDIWATTDQGKGTLGPATASGAGIVRPEFLPARRIDYLLSFGWVYGKAGGPVTYGRFGEPLEEGGLELSDHYGIWADFLL